jgi:hypothetical protein
VFIRKVPYGLEADHDWETAKTLAEIKPCRKADPIADERT